MMKQLFDSNIMYYSDGAFKAYKYMSNKISDFPKIESSLNRVEVSLLATAFIQICKDIESIMLINYECPEENAFYEDILFKEYMPHLYFLAGSKGCQWFDWTWKVGDTSPLRDFDNQLVHIDDFLTELIKTEYMVFWKKVLYRELGNEADILNFFTKRLIYDYPFFSKEDIEDEDTNWERVESVFKYIKEL